MLSTELAALMNFIGTQYVFSGQNYPALKDAILEQREGFAVSHSAHHMSKTLGRISAECESFDHSGTMDKTTLREATVKMFIHTLKLAEEIGMTADDICSQIPELTMSK